MLHLSPCEAHQACCRLYTKSITYVYFLNMRNSLHKDISFDSGFKPGVDNKLQQAMLENLEKSHEEQLALGHTDEAASIEDDINALRLHVERDSTVDPFDKSPDTPEAM
jgi:hypothetical protein